LFEDFSQVGVTVLIASHDLDLISRLPYRQLTLKEGQLVGDSDPSALEAG
ncbi:MAG TPA: cell division ATP-binding protein FtsE, partial [Gammaproteobacteria bacterium]|nr:cell division ATP-binding protein FtsE [Gammaproteobacteria bacterium]